MGRFALNDDNDDCCWEFVANSGEEGALVVKETTRSDEKPHKKKTVDDPSDSFAVIVPHSPPKTIFSQLRKVSLFVILLSYLLQRYLPPAPPLSETTSLSTTWTEFLAHHFFQLGQSLTVLTVQIPLHVSQWIVSTITMDLQLAYERYHESQCRFRPLTRLLPVAGQPLAVQMVMDTIETWSHTKPLFVLLTGFPHTGQTTLVQAIVEELWSDCVDGEQRLFLATNWNQQWSQMTHHAQVYPSGAMIFIPQVQVEDTTDLLLLLRADDAWTSHTLVLVGSHTIGRSAIARALRQDQFHYNNTVLWNELLRRQGNWDAVIPFQPLTRDTLRDVVSLKISRLADHPVMLTDRFLNVWLDQAEYLEWKRRDTPDDEAVPFLTVALQGAQMLDDSPLWKRFLAGWKRCSKETVYQMDYWDGDIVLQSDEGQPGCSFPLL
ncbi:hypothetical protein FisN_34Lh033 [Fistulifera solaris]|uniref:Uncharacterized protein n=1 Tax=Fistulifera solaris TaxID=1519565 RepID=A0A1Z5JHV3_FISSO|nr:hypothetical protein FisN_34Lh033 [Fistulifera solaris]|eukprot:GAX13432.1 hypothetical protein FisN_34Lh033 [Fistulifera solaris]